MALIHVSIMDRLEDVYVVEKTISILKIICAQQHNTSLLRAVRKTVQVICNYN